MVLGDFGCFLAVSGGFGRFQLFSGGFGWFWLFLGGFGINTYSDLGLNHPGNETYTFTLMGKTSSVIHC